MNYINGVWQAGNGSTFEAINPSNGETTWSGNTSSSTDVDAAVAAATDAFGPWSKTPIADRIAVIDRFGELLRSNADSLSAKITSETGKPLWESKTEAAAMAAKISISVEAHNDRNGTTIAQIAGAASVTRHRPLGVLAVFGPYNFPGHLPNGHIIPALIAGNTVVFKPSELTPGTAELTVSLWDRAGLRAGVLNMVQGAADTGKALSAHSGLNGLLFTGSVGTGRILHRQFAGSPEKMLALELGGNNPLVVRQVEDLKAAVLLTLQSGYISAGQRCTCARRLLVPDSPWGDCFVEALVTAVRSIKVGDPTGDDQPFMGPVVSAKSAQMLIAAQQHLISLGAVALVPLEHLDPKTGFVSPGLIDVTGIEGVPDEEYFGPLVQLSRYSEFSDAIAAANNTQFGLAAGLISDDHLEYEQFLEQVDAGIINWNKPTTGASSGAPFGGTGASGNHRPAAYYAADYVSHPTASIETPDLTLPETLPPGLTL